MVNLKENGIMELSSDQLSGKVQYERERFPVRNRGSGEKVDIFLGYRRGLDFDAENKPGQDFAAVWSDGGGYVVGVVADGVSESFYGHLAAYHLSEPLLKVLWRMRERPPSQDELERGLKELEKRVATEVIENQIVPDNLDSFLRESLESKRPEGSQAVFSAFVLDASKSQLHLYQVGDVDAIVHYPDKYPELIQAPSKGRWSSAGKSQMRLKSSTFEGVTGIMIKSDGTGKGWDEGWGKSLKDRALNEGTFNILSAKRAGIDDLSFIAVRWGEVLEAPETEIEEPRSTGPSPPRDGKGVLPGTIPYGHYRGGSREEEHGRGVPDPPTETEVLPGTIPYGHNRGGLHEAGGGRGPVPPFRPPPRLDRLRVAALLAGGAVAGALMALLIAVFLIGGDAPEVRDASYSIGVGETLSVPAPGVLANDAEDDDDVTLTVVDAKPDPLRPGIDPVDRPSNGEVLLNSDGSFSYTPTPGFSGEDTFTYRASDGTNESDVATVTIAVNDSPPVANDDPNYNTVPDQPLTVDATNGVLANDTGDQRTATLVDGPRNGSLELNPDGSFTYTPNGNNYDSDTFTYSASDGTNESNVATVTIMVTAAGGAPKAQPRQAPSGFKEGGK